MASPSIQDLISSFQNPSFTKAAIITAGTGTALGLAWLVRDKQQWAAFGTGGTPPTWSGYWRITKLRIRRALSAVDLTDHSFLQESSGPTYLRRKLPDRAGPRPKINSWTLPQRQERIPIDPEVAARLHSLTKNLHETNQDILRHDVSRTEGGNGHAIYAQPNLKGRAPSAQDKALGDEIAHVHVEENSVHVWLSEADCKEVLRTGWGERFPLSSMNMVHPGWTFLYAPRTIEEIVVVEEIVKAGVAYLTGKVL